MTVLETSKDADVCIRMYQMENGDDVTMGRVQNKAESVSAYSWTSESEGVFRYYDKTNDSWIENKLSSQTLHSSMVELSFENGYSYLIYVPKTYRIHEKGVMEYLPDRDGSIHIVQNNNTWNISLQANLPDANCVSDFTIVKGPRPMLNWELSNCGDFWKYYTLETEGKWCFDGYYFPCPYNYIPTGENYLYNCPAAYLVNSMVYGAPFHPAANNLALAMLDTLSLEQNDSGYWSTSPMSEWLFEDYGVEKGFYDTRFNSDLIRIYRFYYDMYGGDVLRDTMDRYANFFVEFAQQEHFLSPNEGWFVPDYTPASKNKPHSSLNHQLAEIIVLYELSDTLQRLDLKELADKMLFAISDTTSLWVADTGDLHYCVFPDGTFGLQDYPYLTYNDLFDLQKLLFEQSDTSNSALQFLMDKKRHWMDSNSITEYKK